MNTNTNLENMFNMGECIVETPEECKDLTINSNEDDVLVVKNLNEHDGEMDHIASEAMSAYDDLCSLGANMSDAHAGKIYEVAATMLKIALDAKDAKSNRRLKTIELQIKQMKTSGEEANIPRGNQFDRNDLLKLIRVENKNSDK